MQYHWVITIHSDSVYNGKLRSCSRKYVADIVCKGGGGDFLICLSKYNNFICI